MSIKLSLFKVFIAVAETGNIQDAANRIGRTPSAISMALKQLQDQVGGELFVSDRKNQLTALGAYLLETARSQLTSHERAVASVQALAKGEIGRVEIACVPSVASNLLPDVIRTFTEKWEHVELDVRDIDTAAVIRAIERGTVELGIASRPRTGLVSFKTLFHDQLVVVCPTKNSLQTTKGVVQWKTLAAQSVIANGIMEGSDHPEIAALTTRASLMVRNTTSLLALVKSGAGISILPELAIPKDDNNLELIPLPGSGLIREVGLIKRADAVLSPAADAFMDVFNSYVQKRVDHHGAWRGNKQGSS